MQSKYAYRRTRELRITYIRGYVEGQLTLTTRPVVSKSWYQSTFDISKATLYKDMSELTEYQIIWAK
jgi:hypothetical protein